MTTAIPRPLPREDTQLSKACTDRFRTQIWYRQEPQRAEARRVCDAMLHHLRDGPTRRAAVDAYICKMRLLRAQGEAEYVRLVRIELQRRRENAQVGLDKNRRGRGLAPWIAVGVHRADEEAQARRTMLAEATSKRQEVPGRAGASRWADSPHRRIAAASLSGAPRFNDVERQRDIEPRVWGGKPARDERLQAAARREAEAAARWRVEDAWAWAVDPARLEKRRRKREEEKRRLEDERRRLEKSNLEEERRKMDDEKRRFAAARGPPAPVHWNHARRAGGIHALVQ
ncbi:hypothetical protein BV25DRAFT_1915798 [Artomyces pyxidatus]|uniref:Uncharacterized protein n=1 Tax=Artomyces pyxidatus TaxID=48021 RepID=A0ACB8T1N4_9AGAM|nr:hypothetical protein BV25DRAFT_1915798 [Artomyces pyxidatus]